MHSNRLCSWFFTPRHLCHPCRSLLLPTTFGLESTLTFTAGHVLVSSACSRIQWHTNVPFFSFPNPKAHFDVRHTRQYSWSLLSSRRYICLLTWLCRSISLTTTELKLWVRRSGSWQIRGVHTARAAGWLQARLAYTHCGLTHLLHSKITLQ